jgi:hypothetical protein
MPRKLTAQRPERAISPALLSARCGFAGRPVPAVCAANPRTITVACARPGCDTRPRAWPAVFPNPDVQADTLTDLATAILAHR